MQQSRGESAIACHPKWRRRYILSRVRIHRYDLLHMAEVTSYLDGSLFVVHDPRRPAWDHRAAAEAALTAGAPVDAPWAGEAGAREASRKACAASMDWMAWLALNCPPGERPPLPEEIEARARMRRRRFGLVELALAPTSATPHEERPPEPALPSVPRRRGR